MNKSLRVELFHRYPSNPILTADHWPYRIHSVFNPGATRLADGTTLLLCRVEDFRGHSHLCAARSKNGIDDWQIDPAPTFAPDPLNYPEELWGIEDARITFVEELGDYMIAYTAFGRSGPGVALARTKDFVKFDRLGLVMQSDDKDAALFPCRFGGEFLLIHRPANDHTADMWISFSPDLQNWGGHAVLLPARLGAWWDANKIGLSPPPIKTSRGWLVLYHGVRQHASGSIYRIGMALFDLNNPAICLRRGQSWIFGPEASYEIGGDVPYAIFPCGTTLLDDGDTLHIYYGAADTSICLAVASLIELLDWLDYDGSQMTGVSGFPEERVILGGNRW
jgi:predicted GH43/DUF377 family glycosyl hydrolase